MPPKPPPSSKDIQAALDKLKQVDPTLASKMETFNKQMDALKESGASQETVAETMKTNMDSLSDTEKSELKSVFGTQGSGATDGPGAPPNLTQDLITQLKTTDSTLADKIQSFQDGIDKLKSSGASDDTIQKTITSDISSLSDSEKSEIQTALDTIMKDHAPSQTSLDSTSSTSSTTSSATSSDSQTSSAALALLQSQFATAYLQSQASQYGSALAFAA